MSTLLAPPRTHTRPLGWPVGFCLSRIFGRVTGVLHVFGTMINPHRPGNPLDVHILRLVRLHGDRLDDFAPLTPRSLKRMDDSGKRRLINDINKTLGVIPIRRHHISVVCD